MTWPFGNDTSAVVKRISNRSISANRKALCPITHVMEHGKIIETQATEQLFIHPQQPWTKRFAEAACHREEVNWKWTALN